MEKPWDKLRKPVKSPICDGSWITSECDAEVRFREVQGSALLSFNCGEEGAFSPEDLRELAEFCNELADQLEGNK